MTLPAIYRPQTIKFAKEQADLWCESVVGRASVSSLSAIKENVINNKDYFMEHFNWFINDSDCRMYMNDTFGIAGAVLGHNIKQFQAPVESLIYEAFSKRLSENINNVISEGVKQGEFTLAQVTEDFLSSLNRSL